MQGQHCAVLLVIAAVLGAHAPEARASSIDNDIPVGTVGHFSVDIMDGGEADDANVTAKGAISGVVTTDSLYEYYSFVDVGTNGGGFNLGTGSTVTFTGNDTATSTGFFTGAGGNTIDWFVTSSIPDGGDTMTSTFTFTARTGTLGSMQFIQYLDGDMLGSWDDFLFTRGSAAGGDLELVSIDADEGVGPFQGGAYTAAQGLANASFAGWAASAFSDLRDDIEGSGGTYSPTGSGTVSLTPSLNAFAGPGWGEADATTALAWNLFAGATSATIVTTFGEVTMHAVPLPPASWMGFALLVGLGVLRRRRRDA